MALHLDGPPVFASSLSHFFKPSLGIVCNVMEIGLMAPIFSYEHDQISSIFIQIGQQLKTVIHLEPVKWVYCSRFSAHPMRTQVARWRSCVRDFNYELAGFLQIFSFRVCLLHCQDAGCVRIWYTIWCNNVSFTQRLAPLIFSYRLIQRAIALGWCCAIAAATGQV